MKKVFLSVLLALCTLYTMAQDEIIQLYVAQKKWEEAKTEVDDAIKVVALPARQLVERMSSQDLKPTVIRNLGVSVMRTHFVQAQENKNQGV